MTRTLEDLLNVGSLFERVVAGAWLYAYGVTRPDSGTPLNARWRLAEIRWQTLVTAALTNPDSSQGDAEAKAMAQITLALIVAVS